MADQTQTHQQNPFQLAHLQASNSQTGAQICSPQQPNQLQCVEEKLLHKNRLQEFAQRAGLPLPVYYTVNDEGPRSAPKFRATVEVDGHKYVSSNTFSTMKAAQQEAAKLALEGISNKVKKTVSEKSTDGGFPPIYKDKVFCKSILHEFAAKINKEKPTYDTVQLEGLVPVFVSSVVFDGLKYTGGHGINKKEAEQLAARAAILSILANSEAGAVLSEIVKSKAKQITALHERCKVDSCVPQIPKSVESIVSCPGKDIEAVDTQQAGDLVENVVSEAFQQESASKKVKVSCDVGDVVENVVSKANQLHSSTLKQESANKMVRTSSPVGDVVGDVSKANQLQLPALQQESANKLVGISSAVGDVVGDVLSKANQLQTLQSPALLRHEFGLPIFKRFSQPSSPSLLPIAFVPEGQADMTSLDGTAAGGGRKRRKKAKNALKDIHHV